jgi:hypothetical protein
MPSPRDGESKKDFLSRCMANPEARSDFPSQDQRFAFCNSQWENRKKSDLFERLKNLFKR